MWKSKKKNPIIKLQTIPDYSQCVGFITACDDRDFWFLLNVKKILPTKTIKLVR